MKNTDTPASGVLYRRYRPAVWTDVIGQEAVTTILKESIDNGRISHAYLFSGTRGTGKTTLARILARALQTADEDIYEIDAASNRGIDDIRHLKEHVSVLPFSSPKKVYIIDEVHMLSKDAWNALLKTLEEPPAHVIFIMATTELGKVPDTIVSRCQTFRFKTPTKESLRKLILKVAKKEGYDIDAGGADLIAILGDGSFRDALGTLEKVISVSTDKTLSRKEIEETTGAPRTTLVEGYISALGARDIDRALDAIATAKSSGVAMEVFLTLVLEKSRDIMLATFSPAALRSLEESLSKDDLEFVSAQAKTKTITPTVLTKLLTASEMTGKSAVDTLPLELASIEICGIV
jgi:DNA polymerase-3 subunit gamma/tau